MGDLAEMVRVLLIVWLSGLALCVLIAILRRRISLEGLFASKNAGRMDPERVAVFVSAVVAIGGYALQIMADGAVCNEDMSYCSMPDVPDTLLYLLAAGNGSYIAGKIVRKYVRKVGLHV